MAEFTLQQILGASMSQVMTKSNEMGIQIVNNIAEDTSFEKLYGDSVRLQQVLAEFLSLSVSCTPPGGILIIAASLTKNHLVQHVNLELRITHTGDGGARGAVKTDVWKHFRRNGGGNKLGD
ncbi:putative histidine kinase/HSP90-like ATPase superfamily [Helianthus annuus]|nr:putative histidine kinase/HSP90-like ATPase superfamily [Helianthus annuus]